MSASYPPSSIWYALPFRLIEMTFCMSSSQLADRRVDLFPVVVQFGELCLALRGELVILAGRAGVRFLPLVVDQPLAPHLAEQGIQRAFLRGELGGAQALEHVGDVDLVARYNFQDQELEEPFPNRAELLGDAHVPSQATLFEQGSQV